MTSLGAVPAGTSAFAAVAREYATLRRGAVVFDRSERSRAAFFGGQSRETLTGLVTNDVVALANGAGQYAAALTAKGKIIADVRIFARGEDLFVDVPALAAGGWWAMIRKYVNPRVTRYGDVSEETGTLGVYGVRARELVAAACGRSVSELAALDMYAHLALGADAGAGFVARVPELGLEGYDLMLPRTEITAWRERLGSLGAVDGSAGAWMVARIEAGRPEWGLDMDEATLAQEANLEALNAISYTKGCYTGQETVARIHFRGHVNRHLRGLQFEAEHLPPVGAHLVNEEGREVGDVRSGARSPRLGGVALGMIRHETETGASLNAQWDGGNTPVLVRDLPFPLEKALKKPRGGDDDLAPAALRTPNESAIPSWRRCQARQPSPPSARHCPSWAPAWPRAPHCQWLEQLLRTSCRTRQPTGYQRQGPSASFRVLLGG